jgi:hypothetical protein
LTGCNFPLASVERGEEDEKYGPIGAEDKRETQE